MTTVRPTPWAPGDLTMPLAGEIYRHHKGDRYEVVGLSTDRNSGDVNVVYRSTSTGAMFHGPLGEFVGSTPDKVRRFTPTGDRNNPAPGLYIPNGRLVMAAERIEPHARVVIGEDGMLRPAVVGPAHDHDGGGGR